MFIVMEVGWQYNDESYDQYGYEKPVKLFKDKKKAQEYANQLTLQQINPRETFRDIDYTYERYISDDQIKELNEIGITFSRNLYNQRIFSKDTPDDTVLKAFEILHLSFFEVLEIE